MSIVSFKKLSPEETLKQYPAYYRDDITCFLIVKDQTHGEAIPVGLYGLIDHGLDQKTGNRIGEGFLTIFPDFRFRVIGKAFLQKLIAHPFEQGFEVVYTWTRLRSWAQVFDRLASLGVHRLDTDPPWDNDGSEHDQTKIWFVKEKG